jgi:hypothetical protein
MLDIALPEDDINSLMTGKWSPVEPFDSVISAWGEIKGNYR